MAYNSGGGVVFKGKKSWVRGSEPWVVLISQFLGKL